MAAAAVLRGGGSSSAAPSMRCGCSCSTGAGGSFAMETGFSYAGSTAPISRVRLSSSALLPTPCSSSSSSPSFMGGAGARFGLVFCALRRSSSLQVHKLARKGLSPSLSSSASRAGLAVTRSVWEQEESWANSPGAGLEKATESLSQVVSDISDNPELIEGHTKPGQLVQEIQVDLQLPRRRLLVEFTCNVCQTRTQRLVNPEAYKRGTVYVQCGGCEAYHKLVDNLGLVVEYDFRKETDSNS